MYPLLIISSVCLLLATPPSQGTEKGSLKRCQAINDKIQFYTDKRRHGGRSSAMQNWRKKRNNYNDLYFKNNCKMHRAAFK